jgi:hypothetical protein
VKKAYKFNQLSILHNTLISFTWYSLPFLLME